MSFLVVRPDGTEETFSSFEEVFAAERTRCPGHVFEPMPVDAQVVTHLDDMDLADFDGCKLCGTMRRNAKAPTEKN